MTRGLKRTRNNRWLTLGALPAFLLIASAAFSQSGRWERVDSYEHCVGGDMCSHVGPLYLEIADRPVDSIRFEAHDDVGRMYRGEIRVGIDRNVLSDGLSIGRKPRTYELSGRGLRGRYLVFEALTSDEVILRKIEIAYGYEPSRVERRGELERERRYEREDRGDIESPVGPDRYGSSARRTDPERSTRHWTEESALLAAVPEVGCIGGNRCRNRKIEIRFQKRGRVGLVRFFAHDFLGNHSRGRVQVFLDDYELADRLEIPKSGKIFELDGRGRSAKSISFVPRSNDEALIKDLQVFEFVGHEGFDREPRHVRSAWKGSGICIGDESCSRGRLLEIPIDGRSVDAIRFFAHSDVGRGYGLLRLVSGTGEVLDEVKVSRPGSFYDHELKKNLRVLTLEVPEGDVVIEELELRSGSKWERYRLE